MHGTVTMSSLREGGLLSVASISFGRPLSDHQTLMSEQLNGLALSLLAPSLASPIAESFFSALLLDIGYLLYESDTQEISSVFSVFERREKKRRREKRKRCHPAASVTGGSNSIRLSVFFLLLRSFVRSFVSVFIPCH